MSRDPWKKCKRCETEKPLTAFSKNKGAKDGLAYICKPCDYARLKEWRAKNPEKRLAQTRRYLKKHPEFRKKRYRTKVETHPEAVKAMWALQYAVRTGRLDKPDRCSVCGEQKDRIEGHHEDYSKPLEVVWLCVGCHHATHRQEATA